MENLSPSLDSPRDITCFMVMKLYCLPLEVIVYKYILF